MDNIFSRLVAHFGTQQQAAAALSVNQSTVSGWVNGKWGMSPEAAVRAEEKTGRAFRREDLCPDFPWSLAGKTAADLGTNDTDPRISGAVS
jgi:DNA-binding transcriptional regulator YdaS (Cro superfamily)